MVRSIKHPNHYRWLLLILVAVILLGPLPFWLTGVGQSAGELSAEVVHRPDGSLASSPKAEALHRLSLPMRIERIIIYPLLLLSFQLSGGALAWRGRLEQAPLIRSKGLSRPERLLLKSRLQRRWPATILLRLNSGWPGRLVLYARRHNFSGRDLLVILLFVLGFNLALFLLYLPFNFYRGLTLPHQFGLSVQTASGWLGDWGKSVLIALVTNGLLWTGFYGLMRLLPRRWPILGGGLLLLFSLVFILLTPILITPLFYEVRPLEDAILRERILNLSERAGLQVDHIDVINASAKTTEGNAYVTGFGHAQRIVIYDTLLTDYSADQIEVVLAHEMGHWYYRHVLWGTLGLGAVSWIGLFGLRWLLKRTWQPLGLRSPTDVAGLPYVMAIVFLATTLSLPAQNAISRYGEAQADQFALTISQKPAAFISLFEQFAEQNLSPVDAPAWEKFIFDTHPSIAERIRMAEMFQATPLPASKQ